MPVKNEAQFIGRSLGSVLAQSYPKESIEIFVIDGASTDQTVREAEALLRNTSGYRRCEVLHNPKGIVPTGLNIGLRNSEGEVIVRVDGHCEIPIDYLRRCTGLLETTGCECAGGVIVTVGETKAASAIALAQSSSFGVGGAGFRTGSGKARAVDTLAFGAYRREVFERVGNFDEELVRNQDDEFNLRLRQAGGCIWLDPSLKTIYYSRAGLRSLWRQYFQYGLFKVRVMQKRRSLLPRHVAPAAFVLGLALGPVAALVNKRISWALALPATYLVANCTATAKASSRNPVNRMRLAGAFSAMHLSYGTGFLVGLFKWRHSQGD
jgi:glycosyltransferase involved in cell wall biosynthesis